MVFKKKQTKTEGIVVGGSKHKRASPDLKKIQKINWRSKKTLLYIIALIMILFFILIGLYINQQIQIDKKIKKDEQTEILQIDDATIEDALKKYEKNPSELPSGAFEPELKKDYFRLKGVN